MCHETGGGRDQEEDEDKETRTTAKEGATRHGRTYQVAMLMSQFWARSRRGLRFVRAASMARFVAAAAAPSGGGISSGVRFGEGIGGGGDRDRDRRRRRCDAIDGYDGLGLD